MKRLLVFVSVVLVLVSLFVLPVSAYTERFSFSKDVSSFQVSFEENYGIEYEVIGTGEYNDYSWENEFLLNKKSDKKKAYFYIDMPEEYKNCKVFFFTCKNPDNIFYVTLEMQDGTKKDTNFIANQYVSFPDDVKTLIFPLPYNEAIGEISFYYDVDYVSKPSDIGYAKDIFSRIFKGLWNNIKDNWLAMVVVCLPLAYGLIFLLIKILNSFGFARLGDIRSVKLGGIKNVALNNYDVGKKRLFFDIKSRLRKGYTIVEVDGNKFIKKVKDNHAQKRK